MIRTQVGYSGGQVENPSYRSMGNHSESIQIEYDPAQITYEELLQVFWDSHSPTSRPWSQQYASIIFYHDEEQQELAIQSREREEARKERKLFTEIVPAGPFYPAEAYHQKYRLQNTSDLWKEFKAMYPDLDDLVASTAAARVNGYLGGYGTCEQLEEEIDSLGLLSAGQDKLRRIVCGV